MTRQIDEDDAMTLRYGVDIILQKCIDSIRAGDMYYVGETPCMDYVLHQIRHQSYGSVNVHNARRLLAAFYQDPTIPSDNYCKCSTGSDCHDNDYTSCLHKTIEVFNAVPSYYLNDRERADATTIITSDKVSQNDTIQTAIQYPHIFETYLNDTINDSPELLTQPCRINDTNTPISCLQTLFESTYLQGKVYPILYKTIAKNLSQDSPLRNVAQSTIIVDDVSDTPATFYDWIAQQSSSIAFHTHIFNDGLFGAVLNSTACTGTDNRTIPCIEAFMNSSPENVLAALYHAPEYLSRFDHAHTTNGVTYLDTLLTTITDIYNDPTPIPVSDTADVPVHEYAQSLLMSLIQTNSDAVTTSPLCTSSSGKHISCIQKVIDATIEHHHKRDDLLSASTFYSNAALLAVFNSVPTLTRNACITDGSGTVSCIDYMLHHLTEPDQLPEFLSENTDITYSLLSEKIYTKLSPELQQTVCSMVDDDFIADNERDLRKNRDRMNAVARCKCGTANTPETRKCYDDLCFEINDASANSGRSDWVKEIIASDDNFDLQPDNLQINGIYTLNFISANDPETINRYSRSVNSVLSALRNRTNLSFTVANPVTAPLTGDIVVKVTDVHNNAESTHKLSRLARIPAVRSVFDAEPNIAKEFNTLLTTKPSSSSQTLKLVISNRPYDMMRASTCQNWSSCLNVGDGGYRDTIHTFIEYGGYIAYLAKDEWSPQWFARLWILPTTYYKCVSIQPAYGLPEYDNVITDAVKIILAEKGFNTNACQGCYGDGIFPWLDDIRSEDYLSDDDRRDLGYDDCMDSETAYTDARNELINDADDGIILESDEYEYQLNELVNDYRDDTDEEPDDDTMDELRDRALERARDSYEPDDDEINDRMNDYCNENAMSYAPENNDDNEFIPGYHSWIDISGVSVIDEETVARIKQIRGDTFVNPN